jgi:hypothetical protein
MKYLCLIYNEEKVFETTPAAELQAISDECVEQCDALEKSGVLLACERLQPVRTATTIRVRNGKPTITDGPFAETREQLGGFFLIEARDLNEAIRIAEKLPPGRLGSIEVRPVME